MLCCEKEMYEGRDNGNVVFICTGCGKVIKDRRLMVNEHLRFFIDTHCPRKFSRGETCQLPDDCEYWSNGCLHKEHPKNKCL